MSGADGGNAFDWSSDLGQGSAATVLGSGNTIDHLDTYMNPYTDDVIDRSVNDMTRMNDILLRNNAAAAEAGDAFGGDRHGIVDAVTTAETVKNIGDLSSGLRHQGFNTAAGLAQGHVGQDITRANALRGLAGDAFNAGGSLLDRQEAQGDKAYQASQNLMDVANSIFAGNDPAAIAGTINDMLSGSPLAGEETTTGSRDPSTAEKLGLVVGAASDVAGMK